MNIFVTKSNNYHHEYCTQITPLIFVHFAAATDPAMDCSVQLAKLQLTHSNQVPRFYILSRKLGYKIQFRGVDKSVRVGGLGCC